MNGSAENIRPGVVSVSSTSRRASMRRWVRRIVWDLFGLDVRALATARILLALVILVDLVFLVIDAQGLYGAHGVLPKAAFHVPGFRYAARITLHLLFDSPVWFYGLIALQGISATMLLIGWRARTAAAVTWILFTSLSGANPLAFLPGFAYAQVMLFLFMFLPIGSAYAFDARASAPADARKTMRLTPWTAAFVMNIFFFYLFASLFKIDPAWHDGRTASLVLTQFGTHVGLWLASFPALTVFFTYAVWYTQRFAVALFFFPFYVPVVRATILTLLIIMHNGLGFTMLIGPFSLVCSAALIALLPSRVFDQIERLARALGRRLLPGFGNTRPNPAATVMIGDERGRSRNGRSAHAFAAALEVMGASAFIGVTLWLGLSSIPQTRDAVRLPAEINRPLSAAGLRQVWGFFAPTGLTTDKDRMGWVVVVGTLKDGTRVDLIHTNRPLTLKEPEGSPVSLYDEGYRWSMYYQELAVIGNQSLEPFLLAYKCRKWNEAHDRAAQVESAQFVYFIRHALRTDVPVERRPGVFSITRRDGATITCPVADTVE